MACIDTTDEEDQMAVALSEIRNDKTYALQVEIRQLKEELDRVKLFKKSYVERSDRQDRCLTLERAKNKVLKLELAEARRQLKECYGKPDR